MSDFALPSAARSTDAKRPTLIVMSHLRWDFVFQRPQHLLTRAARDFDVQFVEEPIWMDGAEPGVVTRHDASGVCVVQPTLPHGTAEPDATAHQRALIEAIVARAVGPVILWYYTPMALIFSRAVRAAVVVFDKMDELSAFDHAPPVLLALEQELLERADIVFTGGAAMHEAAAHRHADIHCFPSSIDAPHFAAARAGGLTEPADQAGIARPRVGFFGVIDERFDAKLVGDLAALAPELQLVMIGPVVKIDPASLPRAANIHWLGGKTYAELPAYLAGWDAGIMPFAINAATRFISPTKTPEFLAAGLPVVSTPIRDVVRPYGDAGLVEIASTAADMLTALTRVLARPRAPWLASVDAQLAGGSWDATWTAMRTHIERFLDGNASAVPQREAAHV